MSALLAVAIAVLIALVVANWSGSLLEGLGAVGLGVAVLVVVVIAVVMSVANGDYL